MSILRTLKKKKRRRPNSTAFLEWSAKAGNSAYFFSGKILGRSAMIFSIACEFNSPFLKA